MGYSKAPEQLRLAYMSFSRYDEDGAQTSHGRRHLNDNVLNVFIDIQTSKELIQMDTDKMMTYGTYTMDDEKLTQS